MLVNSSINFTNADRHIFA